MKGLPGIPGSFFKIMKTIFVVDDSDTNLLKAGEALEDRYRILTMPSAAKMFTLLEKMTPDLILLDIEMPEMNGFEAIQRLKSPDSPTKNIPVIFLTGHSDAATQTQGRELGALDFVAKPFTAPELLDCVGRYV